MNRKAAEIRVFGLVQGVGFRPFLYRLATRLDIAGRVLNRNDCVEVLAEGESESLDEFIELIREEAPGAASVERIERRSVDAEGIRGFHIGRSGDSGEAVTRVSPDIATCEECLEDIRTSGRRFHYPFTNCTNCGPRFTIVQDLPYDRKQTTMSTFTMCDSCRTEYDDITDRRFHAQPNACRECGPGYVLRVTNSGYGETAGRTGYGHEADGGSVDRIRAAPGAAGLSVDGTEPAHEKAGHGKEGAEIIHDTDEIIDHLSALLVSGGVAAVKGVGGYHLACNARGADAVDRIRRAKLRDGKPFAVMCRDIGTKDRRSERRRGKASSLDATSDRAAIVSR